MAAGTFFPLLGYRSRLYPDGEKIMLKAGIMWLLGVPIVVIIALFAFGVV